MNIKTIVLSGLLLIGMSASMANTTPTYESTVAVVDMHKLLDNSPKMDAMRKSLEKQFSTEHDAITKAQTALQEKAKKVETDSSVMSKERLAKEKASLQKAQQQLQERQIKFQQSVYTAQDKAMKTVLDEVTAVVKTIATKNHYDLVVPKNSTIYSKDSYDITAQVSAQLSK